MHIEEMHLRAELAADREGTEALRFATLTAIGAAAAISGNKPLKDLEASISGGTKPSPSKSGRGFDQSLESMRRRGLIQGDDASGPDSRRAEHPPRRRGRRLRQRDTPRS